MDRTDSYEVRVAVRALDSLIDAVHEATARSRGRSRLPVPHDNVIAVAVPAVTDLPLANVRTRPHSRRPVAAITVTAGLERTDIVFALDPDAATASFSGTAPLSGLLANASASMLEKWGFRPIVTKPPTDRLTDPTNR